VAVARREDRLQDLVAKTGGPSSRIVPMAADVGNSASMETMARTVLETHGVPDVVVANAGIGLDARFVETTDEALRRVFEVNVFGAVRTIRPFLPGMIDRGSGRVLIVSSVVGRRGTPNYSAYAGSKFALHGMADALRPELCGTGVTVGIVCPSSTTTEFQEHLLRHGPPQKRTRVQLHAPESVARAILRMARSTRRQRILSPEGKLMVLVNAVAPGLIDWVLAKVLLTEKR